MAFDRSLDENLFSETVDFDTTRITVGVFSYSGGTHKLQISRENRQQTSGEWTFSKLGRMVKEEAVAILPLMEKAIKVMQPSEEPMDEE